MSTPHTFSESGAKRVVSAVRRVEAQPGFRGVGAGGPQFIGDRPIFAQIDTVDIELGQFEASELSNANDDFSKSRSWVLEPDANDRTQLPALIAKSGVPFIPPLSVVPVFALPDLTNGGVVWYTPGINANDVFRVIMSQVGGAAGTATAAPTYTYDVECQGVTLAEAATLPSMGFVRPIPNGIDTPATFGIASMSEAGDVSILHCNEAFSDTEECPA